MKTILGYTEEVTTCGCCGKTNLKGSYALEIDGVLNYYGSTCAFKQHGIKKTTLDHAMYLMNIKGRKSVAVR